MTEAKQTYVGSVREGDTIVAPGGDRYRVLSNESVLSHWIDDDRRYLISAFLIREPELGIPDVIQEKYYSWQRLAVIPCPHDAGTTEKMHATICSRCNLVLEQR